MGWEELLGLILSLLVMSVGLAGSIIPALPSTPLVLLVAIGHMLYFGDAGVGMLVMGCRCLVFELSVWMKVLLFIFLCRLMEGC